MTNFFDLMQNIVNALNVVVRAQDRTVRVDKQNFTEEQKAQARENIGVVNGSGGSTEGAVLYTAQELTEDQKAQARENIGVDAYIEEVFLGGAW